MAITSDENVRLLIEAWKLMVGRLPGGVNTQADGVAIGLAARIEDARHHLEIEHHLKQRLGDEQRILRAGELLVGDNQLCLCFRHRGLRRAGLGAVDPTVE